MESPESEEELYKIAQRFKGVSLLVNNVEGGKTPILQPKQLQEMGVGADDLLTQGADFDCPRETLHNPGTCELAVSPD